MLHGPDVTNTLENNHIYSNSFIYGQYSNEHDMKAILDLFNKQCTNQILRPDRKSCKYKFHTKGHSSMTFEHYHISSLNRDTDGLSLLVQTDGAEWAGAAGGGAAEGGAAEVGQHGAMSRAPWP